MLLRNLDSQPQQWIKLHAVLWHDPRLPGPVTWLPLAGGRWWAYLLAIHLQLLLDDTPSRSVKMTHDLPLVRWQDARQVGEDWILSNVLRPWAHHTHRRMDCVSTNMCSLFASSLGFTSLHCIILLISLLKLLLGSILRKALLPLFSQLFYLFWAWDPWFPWHRAWGKQWLWQPFSSQKTLTGSLAMSCLPCFGVEHLGILKFWIVLNDFSHRKMSYRQLLP